MSQTPTEPENPEARILAAAKEVFHQKGLSGARMQEIADAAGINKAMLHYYFRSKNQLFERILREALGQVIPKVAHTLQADLPLEEKFRRVSGYYHQLLRDNPQLPMFVLNALQHQPEQLTNLVQQQRSRGFGDVLVKFLQQMQGEMQAGNIRPLDPRHVLLNLIGTTVFPFMMRPVLTEILGLKEEDFDQFVQAREALVPELLMRSIAPDGSHVEAQSRNEED